MRLIVGGGGSGGHAFPALAVAETLRIMLREDLTLLYVGREDGMEAAIARDAGIEFAPIVARALRGRHPLSQLWSTLTLAAGVWGAIGVVRRFQPDVVFVTGGYVSVPIGVAAWLLRRPLVLFLPDVEPGWAVRLLSRLARRICVTDTASMHQLPARKTVATGYPLRPVFRELDRPMARARFELNGDPVILITAAVQGSQNINRAVETQLEEWLEAAQIIHVSGARDEARLRARRDALPAALQRRYHLYEYLGDELPMAMAASDLAVARSGASVLGELPAAGLPAVLVPLTAAGGHQRHNAAILQEAGAAVIVEEGQAAATLLPTALEILRDRDRLTAMRQAARAKARTDAAERIAEVLWEVRQ